MSDIKGYGMHFGGGRHERIEIVRVMGKWGIRMKIC